MNSSIFDIAEKKYKSNKTNLVPTEEKKSGNIFDQAIQNKKEYSFENENDLEREIERQQARLTSRGLETVIGLPGNIYSLANSLFGIKGLGEFLPTSEKLKEVSEKATQGYTKPQSELEKFGDELFSDIVGMSIPGSSQYSIMRNIGIPLLGNLSKESLKSLDAGDTGQTAAKFATMIGLDLLTHRKHVANGKGIFGGGAKQYAQNLFTKMEDSIPKGLSINSGNLEKYLNDLEGALKQGGSHPATPKALEKIKELKSDIKNGKIDLKTLLAYRPSINAWIEDLGGFEWISKPRLREQAIKNLNEVKKVVIKTGEEYGEKFNPEFLKLSRDANEAYSVYSKSNQVSKIVDKLVGSKLRSAATKALFGLGSLGIPFHPQAALATVPLAAGYKGYKIFHRVLKSPSLRNYYGNVLKGALLGNTDEVTKNALKLDEELSKESNQSSNR